MGAGVLSQNVGGSDGLYPLKFVTDSGEMVESPITKSNTGNTTHRSYFSTHPDTSNWERINKYYDARQREIV